MQHKQTPAGRAIFREAMAVTAWVAAGAAAAWAFDHRWRQPASLAGATALITGGSRGLGLLLAHEFARAGCRLAICARDEQELAQARAQLERAGAEVFALPCDVTEREQVEQMVARVTRHYGQIDILVNNAGIIQVGPAAALGLDDFEQALATLFWGLVYTTLAVVPQMRARGAGRIVNITSIGGRVSVPHLLPYNSAKFAAVGFSEGLAAELARDGITVTTVVPGLMRTGSHLQAMFQGQPEKEFSLFTIVGSLPIISMDAERAAHQIVEATRRGARECVLTAPAALLARFHGLWPGLTVRLFGIVNRWLPQAGADPGRKLRGSEARAHLPPHHRQLLDALSHLNRQAARHYQHLELPE